MSNYILGRHCMKQRHWLDGQIENRRLRAEVGDKYKKMIAWIEKDLNITSLRYQEIDDMVEAIGLPKEKLCTYCWNGEE